MSFARSFPCDHCGVDVSLDAPGTSHRNHCPRCLWSRHLDRNSPGDRKSGCPGGMEPIAVTVRGEHRWVLIHRCTHCGRLRLNRTAADDNMLALIQIAALPLATPPSRTAHQRSPPPAAHDGRHHPDKPTHPGRCRSGDAEVVRHLPSVRDRHKLTAPVDGFKDVDRRSG